MKKLLKTLIASAAVFACAMTTTFALPSASVGGSVVGEITIDGVVVKDAKVSFEAFTEETPKEVIAISEKLNAGTAIEEVLKDVNITLPTGKKLSDFKLLTNLQNLVARNADGEIIENAKNVKITWEVPNLTANNDVYVLHYSTVRNVWEIITPEAVDVAKGTVTAVFPDLSPVAVIHTPKAGTPDSVTPPTGDATNMALYAGVGVAALAIVAVIIYRNKKYN